MKWTCECDWDTGAFTLTLMHLNYSAVWLIWLVMFGWFVRSGRCVARAISLSAVQCWFPRYSENTCFLSAVSLLKGVANRHCRVWRAWSHVSFVCSCCTPFRLANYFQINFFCQSQNSTNFVLVTRTTEMMTMMMWTHLRQSTTLMIRCLHLRFYYWNAKTQIVSHLSIKLVHLC